MAQTLRVMAQENRDMRMAEAEKKAAALPPKLTVPMILFFLPVLFVVILGPAAIRRDGNDELITRGQQAPQYLPFQGPLKGGEPAPDLIRGRRPPDLIGGRRVGVNSPPRRSPKPSANDQTPTRQH
jgi:hypothetical protein